MDLKEKKYNQLVIPVLLVLTLGLAPFNPEPHLFGKIRWIFGGGEGMATLDYLDLLMHSFPWLLFVFTLIKILIPAKPSNNANRK
ncbi:MAG: hypothetical protein ACNS60_16365 [Candidatus Cyclobacteriaceae bacterium M2_1C_046]